MKITLTDNSTTQASQYEVSNYIFNKMTEEEQANLLCYHIMGHYGTGMKTLLECKQFVQDMQEKYGN